MGEFNSVSSQLGIPNAVTATEVKRTSLSFKEYQDLKSSVHRDLISRVDLERVANQRDDHTRGQVLSVIQDLVANLKTPLSGRERERLALEVLDEVFGLGPLEPVLQRSEEHTSELQSLAYLVCRLLLEKKKTAATLSHAPHEPR